MILLQSTYIGPLLIILELELQELSVVEFAITYFLIYKQYIYPEPTGLPSVSLNTDERSSWACYALFQLHYYLVLVGEIWF